MATVHPEWLGKIIYTGTFLVIGENGLGAFKATSWLKFWDLKWTYYRWSEIVSAELVSSRRGSNGYSLKIILRNGSSISPLPVDFPGNPFRLREQFDSAIAFSKQLMPLLRANGIAIGWRLSDTASYTPERIQKEGEAMWKVGIFILLAFFGLMVSVMLQNSFMANLILIVSMASLIVWLIVSRLKKRATV